MLARIIENFLAIPAEAAVAIISLLKLEGRWKERQSGISKITKETKEIYSSEIKTQADFVEFLQFVGQKHWFKGHDRSKFPVSIAKSMTDDDYMAIFPALGFAREYKYDTSQGKPHFYIVLGSSESQVRKRVATLTANLADGLLPLEKKVFGLGANRKLGESVVESEEVSKAKLLELKQELTEMNMVNLQIQDAIVKFEGINYQEINTTAAVTREHKDCVTTAKTAVTLKQVIESDPIFSRIQRPIRIACISNSPFVERQRRDVQNQLGEEYQVIGIGAGISIADLKANPRAISICLGEVARLINISYAKVDLELLKSRELTKDELEELQGLSQDKLESKSDVVAESKKSAASSATVSVTAFSSHFQQPAATAPTAASFEQGDRSFDVRP